MRRRFLHLAVAATLAAALPAAGAESGVLKPASGKATPFTLRDLDGRELRLADYRGKVVVLNFWATWCDPCRDEMPALGRLAAKFAGRPFAVLAVDLAEGAPRVREFAESQRIGFPLLLDRDGAVARAWNVRALPVTYVIDADQGLRHVALGALEWDSPAIVAIIEKLLPGR